MKREYRSGGNGESTNLYVSPVIKKIGKQLAKEKKISLSNLFELLITAESKRKRGIAHLHAPVDLAGD